MRRSFEASGAPAPSVDALIGLLAAVGIRGQLELRTAIIQPEDVPVGTPRIRHATASILSRASEPELPWPRFRARMSRPAVSSLPSMPPEYPFNLSSGLALDSPPLTIPWDLSTEELCRVGTPDLHTISGVTFVSWKGNTVLGGIPVDVLFRSNASKCFWLELRNRERFSSAHEAYNHLRSQLVARLGEPQKSVVDEGYPWVTWHYGGVRVSLRIAERFVEYVSFMISNGL